MRAARLLRGVIVMAILFSGLIWSAAAMATTYDVYEADNSAAAAKTIAFGTTQQRSVYPAGDVDWIKFSATAGTMYRIETTRATILPDAFTDLELYAANGTTLLASDYDGTGQYSFSRLVWTAPASGTFLLRVDGPPLMEGNYALRILGTTGLRYVRGTVTADDGGAPIEGIVVGASTAGGDLLGRSVTVADGTYAVPLFYDDAYGISFSDPTRSYKDEWYDNAYHPSGRKLVAVGAAGVTGIDAGMTTGAVVSGVVTDESTGLPLPGITVHLLIDSAFVMSTQSATTAADGSYRFTGLAAGRYSIACIDPAERYRSEHHDGQYWSGYFESGAFDDATWVNPALGETATINASLLEKPTISGRVTGPDGSPLAGRSVTVRLVTPSDLGYAWVETTTDSNGEWTAGVDGPGPFWVKVTDYSGTYVSEYYDDVVFTEPASATPVVVADYGVHLTGIDSQLARAGNIVQGYVEHSGVVVPGIQVIVWEKTANGWRRVPIVTRVTDNTGYYSIGGLPVGMTACLEFQSPDTLTDYAGNAPSLDLAKTFVVGPDTHWFNVFDIHFDPYRAAGSDRYKTAVAGSLLTYPSENTKTVVIASGTGFADALSASALAGAVDGPVLLASRYDVPAAVLEEIERLGATKAYVVGGTSALDDFVLRAIKTVPGMAYPTRVAGSDRYETSARVAETVAALDGSAFSRGAFIARGDTYPDALAAGPFAYSQGMPVLLTRPTELPTSISSAIESLDITSTVICGDVTAVSASVASEIQALNSGATTTLRRGGATRYDTSAVIARYGIQQGWCFDYRMPFGYATGTNFPDALAGASTLGARNGCLMLVTPNMLPGSVREVLSEYKTYSPGTIVLGDKGVVSDGVVQAIQNALVLPPE